MDSVILVNVDAIGRVNANESRKVLRSIPGWRRERGPLGARVRSLAASVESAELLDSSLLTGLLPDRRVCRLLADAVPQADLPQQRALAI